MGNQIEKFDPSRLMDGVRDRIKATFVSLIPDDAWDEMVEKELYIFTTGRIIPHSEYKGSDENGKPIYLQWDERQPYTQEPAKDDYGHTIAGKYDISPLQQMIRDMLHDKFRQDLASYMQGEEYQAMWSTYGLPQVSKAIEEIVVKNADTIFYNIIAGMVQSGFTRMRGQIISDVNDAMNRQY